jgi:predicted hotdog family 3-hydroxylacyl-ACP dehydratase
MTSGFPPIAELVPHEGPLRLIDEVLASDDDHIVAVAIVRSDGPFHVAGRGVPGYLAFEYMAQTISAQDGLERRKIGQRPQLGFLLGSRKYEVATDWFEDGERLEITARAVLNEGELRAFACTVSGRGNPGLATALVNVYRPDDPAAFVRDS